jgi:plastocyanin
MRAFLNRVHMRGIFSSRALLLIAAIYSAGVAPYVFAMPRTHTVVIEAMQFSPQVLEVNSGDTVIWVNKDAFPHNATAVNRSFQSKEMATNGSWKFKAAKKGSFPYLCTLHPTMKASLVVK